jgi:hypothetical protein
VSAREAEGVVAGRVKHEQEVCFYGFIERQWLVKCWPIPFVSLDTPTPALWESFGLSSEDDSLFQMMQQTVIAEQKHK